MYSQIRPRSASAAAACSTPHAVRQLHRQGYATATTSLFLQTQESKSANQIYTGTYNATYDTPIALADLARTWTSGSGITPVSSITIGADARCRAGPRAGQSACTFTGSFKLRATGKDTLAFSGSSCSYSGKSMSVEATVISGQMTIVGVTQQRDAAFFTSAQ